MLTVLIRRPAAEVVRLASVYERARGERLTHIRILTVSLPGSFMTLGISHSLELQSGNVYELPTERGAGSIEA